MDGEGPSDDSSACLSMVNSVGEEHSIGEVYSLGEDEDPLLLESIGTLCELAGTCSGEVELC